MFEQNDTQDKVISLIAQTVKIDKKDIQPTMTFEQLGIDSVEVMEVIIKIEEEFGIEIPDDKAAKIASIRDAVEAIHALRTK
ncbi:MAG: acyl carrier protein [Candidatus Babeliales bacterium]